MTIDARLLAIPIAAVGEDWLGGEFLPALDEAISQSLPMGGVLWLPVDSSYESQYLLAQIAHNISRWNRSATELVISESDPLLFWLKFTGFGDTGGMLGSLDSNLLLAVGGEFFPPEYLGKHIATIDELCKASRSILVLPIFRLAHAIPAQMQRGVWIRIPPLSSFSPERLSDLIETLIHARMPGLSEEDRRVFLSQFIAFGPKSRAHLENWISEYSQSEDPITALRSGPPPLASDPLTQPNPIPGRQYLSDRFQKARKRLEEADLQLRSVCQLPLIFRHQPLNDPFESHDPSFWFLCLVSHLSCVVFDAGERGLLSVARRSYDQERDDISGDPGSELPEVLRNLRTSLQHGMDLDSARNRKILDSVAAWYQRFIGATSPRPEHARKLSAVLIEMWEDFVCNVCQVVENLPRARSAPSVLRQIEMEAGGISSGVFLHILDNVVNNMDRNVCRDRIKKKYEHTIRSKLRTSCLIGEDLEKKTRQLIEDCVADESNLCPIDSDWLKTQGVPEGAEMGSLLQTFRAEWNVNPSCRLSPRDFIDQALAKLPSMRGHL